MIKLNNKGQSLVMFILIIPIIILVLILVVDIGNAIYIKNKLDNVNYLVMDYALDNKNSSNLNEEVITLVNKNMDGISFINIDNDSDYIYISITKKISGIISDKVIVSEAVSKYKGYIKEDKKIIERV